MLAAAESVVPDSFPQIALGGTAGLILFMALCLWLFATNRVKRVDPDEPETIKKLTEALQALTDGAKETSTLVATAVAAIEKMTATTSTLLQKIEIDKEVKERLAKELREIRATDHQRSSSGSSKP